MSISAQRFATKARTWLFVAALTALLIGIGLLIGGVFLYAFVALAIATSVLAHEFGHIRNRDILVSSIAVV